MNAPSLNAVNLPVPTDLRRVLARRALAEIPRFLTLQDRTPVSPTYGCFDRDYWHVRMMDFPCGMHAKLVLPLALAWSLPMPGNRFYRQPAIRDWAEAGIRYAARSAHADGSCDDYYPYERAAGAAAFSLRACLEASDILGLAGDDEIDSFLIKRAGWLAAHRESGRLSNHEALITNCLARMAARFGERWEAPMRERLTRLLSWQDREGWFAEYEGADPGYLTMTIAQLADLDLRRPDLGLRGRIQVAIDYVATMLHPDGTLGGGYASRATRNFFPHGFEIAGSWYPPALGINERAVRLLASGNQPVFPERVAGHHATSWMLAWRDWAERRPGPTALPAATVHFPHAAQAVIVTGERRLYCGLDRGGAFRLYDGDRLVAADTGPTLRLKGGQVAVTHLPGGQSAELTESGMTVSGSFAFAKAARLNPVKSIVLRTLMVTLGRFFPDMVRRMLQKMLVTGRKEAPFRFSREIAFEDAVVRVTDQVTASKGWSAVRQAGIGGFQSSLTTVVARVWQPEELMHPWTDLTAELAQLDDGARLTVQRELA